MKSVNSWIILPSARRKTALIVDNIKTPISLSGTDQAEAVLVESQAAQAEGSEVAER